MGILHSLYSLQTYPNVPITYQKHCCINTLNIFIVNLMYHLKHAKLTISYS